MNGVDPTISTGSTTSEGRADCPVAPDRYTCPESSDETFGFSREKCGGKRGSVVERQTKKRPAPCDDSGCVLSVLSSRVETKSVRKQYLIARR